MTINDITWLKRIAHVKLRTLHHPPNILVRPRSTPTPQPSTPTHLLNKPTHTSRLLVALAKIPPLPRLNWNPQLSTIPRVAVTIGLIPTITRTIATTTIIINTTANTMMKQKRPVRNHLLVKLLPPKHRGKIQRYCGHCNPQRRLNFCLLMFLRWVTSLEIYNVTMKSPEKFEVKVQGNVDKACSNHFTTCIFRSLPNRQVSIPVTEAQRTKLVKWRGPRQISAIIFCCMALLMTNTWSKGNMFSFRNPWVDSLAWIPKVVGPIYKFQVW